MCRGKTRLPLAPPASLSRGELGGQVMVRVRLGFCQVWFVEGRRFHRDKQGGTHRLPIKNCGSCTASRPFLLWRVPFDLQMCLGTGTIRSQQ